MKRTIWAVCLGVCVGFCCVAATFATDGSTATQNGAPRNLAFDAEVWASSEYDGSYSALAAVDGVVAKALSRSDRGNAWCVRGDKTNGKADFELTWEEPRAVSTIVYFGRTGSSMMEEVFRDYEVYLDGDETPVALGTFEMIHGPQFVEFEKREVSTVKIRFLNGYEGGLNWGASEIAVFENRPSAEELAASVNPEAAQPPLEETLEGFREAGMPDEIIFAVRKPGTDEHWYANIGYYADNVCRYPFPLGTGGGIYAYNVVTKETRPIIEDPQGNFRDPQVHYDGNKILFSYLPAGKKHYSLYTINADGTGLARLTGEETDEPLKLPEGVEPSTSNEFRMSAAPLGNARDFAPPGWDDYEPTWLPDDSIVFCSTRAKRYVGCWMTHVGTLYKRLPDGTIRELSCNVEQDNTPWVLSNGQIAYMRWEYVDRSQVDYHHLWTMNQDGTRQQILYGNQKPGTVILAPKPVPDSNKIVCTYSPGHGTTEHYGPIALIDPSYGPDDPRGLEIVSRNNNHSDPWVFDETKIMTASRTKITLLDERGRETTLYQLPQELIDQGFYVGEPRPLAPRDREPIAPDATDPSKAEGTIALLNVYIGRKMGNVEPGTIKELLIYETLPKPIHYTGGTEMMSIYGTFTIERLLGRVPVSEDGSAYFRVPANRPIFFLAMDAEGRCVKRMHSFTSVMPGENLSCVGCHEDRVETAASDEKNRLMEMMKKPPVEIEPIEGVPDVFSFTRDIQPILDKHCLECHNPDREEGGFNISGHWSPIYTIGYAHMSWRQLFGDNRNRAKSNFDPYEIGSGSSRLLKLIDEKHYGVDMPEAERKIIKYWIDAGANYTGTYAAEASGGVGYYMRNLPVRNEKDWPETAAMQEAITRRCDGCHTPLDPKKGFGIYDIYSDNYSPRNPKTAKDMFLPHDLSQSNGRFSRLEIFDLSYPEQSKAVRAPLSKAAGGLGVCEAKSGKPVFTDKDDPDYRTILAGIERGRRYILEEDNRPEMLTPSPNNGEDCPQKFVPRWAYLREMIRYGVLPVDVDPSASCDPYELDEAYWRSLWHKPEAKKDAEPKVDATE
ncbi:MAG: hypothetical protein IKU86_09695 [Thermoguttaceae bacterium]|nr:hypothetical protein [Thermoguttaceae bacterium]